MFNIGIDGIKDKILFFSSNESNNSTLTYIIAYALIDFLTDMYHVQIHALKRLNPALTYRINTSLPHHKDDRQSMQAQKAHLSIFCLQYYIELIQVSHRDEIM